jgi:hypothetical protein
VKKIYIGVLLLGLIIVSTIFYQQYQLIKDYRGLLYGQLYIIQKPIQGVLEFQKTAEQYDDEQRAQLFEPLVNAFSDVFNYTGDGLQLEPQIRELYFGEYNDTKIKYSQSIQAYKEAETSEEREQSHTRLQKQYEAYEEFLKRAETELVEPFE